MVGNSRWRVPVGLLGALALVALIEAAVDAYPLRFTNSASLSWRLSFARAERSTNSPAEIVCLGDSLVKIGVLPRLIEAETGRTAENLAMGHAPAPATYFLLRRLLEAGHRPATVVVDFKPSMLAGGPRFNLREWQEILRPAEAVDLTHHAGGLAFLVEIALGRLLPSYRGRFEIREAIGAALGGQIAPTYRNNRFALRNWTINKGAHLNGSSHPFSGSIPPAALRKLIIPNWECHRANQIYLEKFFNLAEANGIQVVWLIAPSSPELQALRETKGRDPAYAAFIAEAQRRHPSITVIDARHANYPTAVFADATHLNGRGAATFSHELAQILAHPDQKAARWVALPPFRDWPIDLTYEDIERSTAIIDAELIRR